MRVALASLLLLVAAMAGCLASKEGDGDPADGSTTSTTTAARGNGTGGPALVRMANLTADVDNGTAPLAVNFTLNATAGSSSWRLSFGDGSVTNGTALPAVVNHTYVVGGDFSANLTVAYPGGNVSDQVAVAVAVPEGTPGPGAPDVTHFEYADSAGCAGDVVGVENCVSFAGGPDASGIDGYWQALDERYWGLAFTTTVDQGQPAVADSDCAVTDAAFVVLEEPNNGSSPCAGTIPPGTAWIFLYPYGVPALAQTLTFTA